jgi:hypothetical protein
MQTYGEYAGTISLADKMIDLSTDYMTVHALLGVQRLATCVAVPVVTAAEAVATIGGESVFKVTATAVLTANGAPLANKGDARSDPCSILPSSRLTRPSSSRCLTLRCRRPSHPHRNSVHHLSMTTDPPELQRGYG